MAANKLKAHSEKPAFITYGKVSEPREFVRVSDVLEAVESIENVVSILDGARRNTATDRARGEEAERIIASREREILELIAERDRARAELAKAYVEVDAVNARLDATEAELAEVASLEAKNASIVGDLFGEHLLLLDRLCYANASRDAALAMAASLDGALTRVAAERDAYRRVFSRYFGRPIRTMIVSRDGTCVVVSFPV